MGTHRRAAGILALVELPFQAPLGREQLIIFFFDLRKRKCSRLDGFE